MVNEERAKKARLGKAWYKNWQLYVLLLPGLILLLLFNYVPMYGIIIAFQDYVPAQGIWNSEFVGLKHFTRFFESYYFKDLFVNTLRISFWSLVVNTPLPIILALLLNEVRIKWVKRTIQTISYAPYFVSVVVVCSMCFTFLNEDRGVVNMVLKMFGAEPKAFMESAAAFPWIYVISGVWQGTGWSAIIYIGTLSGIDPSLHEAAEIDGASRMQRIRHINIPHIMPVVTIMFILAVGNLLSIGFEKVYLLQTDLNRETSNIIATYVYELVFKSKYQDWSYSTAVGLFNTVINLVLLLSANFISKKVGGESLW